MRVVKWARRFLAVILGLCTVFGFTPAGAADVYGIVVGHSPPLDKTPELLTFFVLDAQGRPQPSRPVLCNAADVQKSVGRALEVNDQVQFVGLPDPSGTSCQLILRSLSIDFWSRLWATAIAATIVISGAAIGARGLPTRFLVGSDNRYSNSQCQLALWFGTAMTFYLATVFLRVYYLGWDHLDSVFVTANVMALTGLSALSFGAAKAVTAQKVANAEATNANALAYAGEAAATAAGQAPGVVDVVKQAAAVAGADKAGTAVASALMAAGKQDVALTVRSQVEEIATKLLTKRKAPKPRLFTDLFQNDRGEVDIGDFQMIFVALTATVIFAFSCFHGLATLPYLSHVSLPDVDTSLLTGFGIGQGAYLMKKAALPLGQV